MTNDRSAQTASLFMGEMQLTLSNFQVECAAWEADLDQLLTDIAAFVDGNPVPPSSLSEAHVASQIGELRHLISQQTELFRCLFDQERVDDASVHQLFERVQQLRQAG